MEPRDIPFAIRLTDTEGWGFTRQDFLRLLRLGSRGCFVALDRDRKVGLISTTTYDGVAWIGNLIVAESARGQGVAIQLLNRAISYLGGRGIRKIGLYSYLETRSLYEKFGFVENALFIRYLGTARSAVSEEVKPFGRDQINEIARFDRDRFGADRRKLLKLLNDEFPQFCFSSEYHGRIMGYIVAKGAQSGYEIGPWVCDNHAGSAEALLKAELTQMKGKRVEVTVPKRNRDATRFLTRLGFSSIWEVLEMFRGGPPIRRPYTIFAVGGLEKG